MALENNQHHGHKKDHHHGYSCKCNRHHGYIYKYNHYEPNGISSEMLLQEAAWLCTNLHCSEAEHKDKPCVQQRS